jgi:outer membrane protein
MTGLDRVFVLATLALVVMLTPFAARAQQDQQPPQPPPFTAPNPPTPAAPNAPGQQAVPQQQQPALPPEALLPQPDKTSVDVRDRKPLNVQVPGPDKRSPNVDYVANDGTRPQAEAPSAFHSRIFSFGGYRAPRVPELSMRPQTAVDGLVRDGKLYLSLHDAIVLAVQNNLDVEVSRYNLLIADTDLTRAQGGGNLRGLDFTIQQTPQGVGATTSPLLITATTGNAITHEC